MTQDKLFDLSGRVAVVTGGCGILGVQHASALANFGAHVVIADLDQEKCEAVARVLTSETGVEVLGIRTDVSDKASVVVMTERILEVFNRVDILINNAAVKSENFFASFEEYSLQDWNKVLAVNLTGMFLCAQSIGRRMLKQGGGSIINIASIYGMVGPDLRLYEGASCEGEKIRVPAVYSASKGAVLSLTRYLATYWADKGIRVNAITPGGIYSGHNDTFVRNYSIRTPLGRMGRQAELQGALIFLASDASSYVTGHNLVVDGGWTAW